MRNTHRVKTWRWSILYKIRQSRSRKLLISCFKNSSRKHPDAFPFFSLVVFFHPVDESKFEKLRYSRFHFLFDIVRIAFVNYSINERKYYSRIIKRVLWFESVVLATLPPSFPSPRRLFDTVWSMKKSQNKCIFFIFAFFIIRKLMPILFRRNN